MRGALLILFVICASWCKGNTDSLTIHKLNTKAYKYYLSNPDSAIAIANKTIVMAEGKYLYQVGYAYYVLSKANWAKANYLLSIHYGFKALNIYENSSHIYHWGECELGLARTFMDLKNLAQAKTHLDEALSLAQKNNDLHLLAEVYREKSLYLLEQNQYDSALYYSHEGINLFEKRKDTLDASILYGRITRIYISKKEFKKGMVFNKKAMRMDSLTNNRRALGISYFMAAQIYYAIHKKDSALFYLKRSVPLNLEIRNLPNMINAHQLMADIYEEQGRIDFSLAQFKLVDQYKDSLYNLEKSRQIQEMMAHVEQADKEKKILSLQTENVLEKQRTKNQYTLSFFFGVVIVLLTLLSFVFWRMRQLQTKVNNELAEKNQNIERQNIEIQRQAETLHEINDLKSKLFSVISHDLRGPINNLQSLLDMVTKEYLSPTEFKDISVKLKSSLNVSQRTLENLLNWSLSQMEGIRTEKTIFNINAIIAEVINLTEETAFKKQVALNNEMNHTLLVEADVNQVHLILRNLLHNAIKFSRHNGSVIIVAEKNGQACHVSVKDSGVGMTDAEVGMILNSHEYFTKSGTDREKGTGLGLHLCKDFIRRNGGELSIASSTDRGTVVTFTLPLA